MTSTASPTTGMQATTLNAYLYQQYADDDNLQALVNAYNDATQAYVDWFNGISLPYYPRLTGDLLNWVAKGLYGQERTQLASPLTPAIGPLNTFLLNTLLINGYIPSSETFYNITDDVFQRILTWNYFKGDGKRFCIRWLKRRVMRFLVGTNGIDPQPSQPGFMVGAETTSAIGVVISGGVVTVSIDQSLLSLQAQLVPNILQLFQLAFEGGSLDLPVEFTYVCTIITNFVAIARPSVLNSATAQAAQTTAAATVQTLGGTGIYTYAWTWQSGGSRISIDDPTSIATTFTATGLAYGETRTGVALCTLNDTVSSLNTEATCLVTITRTASSQLTAEFGPGLTAESGAPLLVEF